VQEGNELGLVESDQTYDQADLDSFFKKLAGNIPNGTHPVLNLMNRAKGPGTPSPNNTETMLDLEIAYPLVYPAGITMFQTSGGLNAILDGLDNVYCDHNISADYMNPPM